MKKIVLIGTLQEPYNYFAKGEPLVLETIPDSFESTKGRLVLTKMIMPYQVSCDENGEETHEVDRTAIITAKVRRVIYDKMGALITVVFDDRTALTILLSRGFVMRLNGWMLRKIAVKTVKYKPPMMRRLARAVQNVKATR